MSKYGEGLKFHILIPLDGNREFATLQEVASFVSDLGFVRFQVGDATYSIADPFEGEVYTGNGSIIIDRLVTKTTEEERHQFETRLKDSVSLAFSKGNGALSIFFLDAKEKKDFYQHAACPLCGYMQQDLSISNFSFNSHHGACEACHGLGSSTTFREEDIVSPNLSLGE